MQRDSVNCVSTWPRRLSAGPAGKRGKVSGRAMGRGRAPATWPHCRPSAWHSTSSGSPPPLHCDCAPRIPTDARQHASAAAAPPPCRRLSRGRRTMVAAQAAAGRTKCDAIRSGWRPGAARLRIIMASRKNYSLDL